MCIHVQINGHERVDQITITISYLMHNTYISYTSVLLQLHAEHNKASVLLEPSLLHAVFGGGGDRLSDVPRSLDVVSAVVHLAVEDLLRGDRAPCPSHQQVS